MKTLKILVLSILVCSLLGLGCASPHYIDMGNCGVRAACVKCAIEYRYPDVKTRYWYVEDMSHVEVEAFIDGEWWRAVLVDIDFKPDIIDFRR